MNSSCWIREPHLAIADPRLTLGPQTPLPSLPVHPLLKLRLRSNSFNHKFHALTTTSQAQIHRALALSSDRPSTSEPKHHITFSERQAANQRQWNQPGGSRGNAHA
ncbi:hypothetical protein [Synechococcus sp. WH 8016]|uniref:hypothetical protein n=1 Tax=Synechococcus sp. WH 8016 TaxID=166318 RepID=UPI00131EF4E8|nr:hypothetical protein [Synechococcus sp. WH 8016]